MASSVPSNAIDAQAARWAARAAGGALPGDQADALEAWLANDRRHRGAYLRARAGLCAIEDELTGVPATVNDNEATPAAADGHAWQRLGRFALGGALAAALVGIIGFGMTTLSHAPVEQASGARNLVLADGSVATLGEGARIDFALSDGVRKVVLLEGEAVFSVAKDRAHPFVVQSGDVYAQATGTVYSVRRIGETGGAVHVDEGSVLVWGRDDREQAVLLHAGGTLTLDPGLRNVTPAYRAPVARPAAPPPVVAQISLENVSIADAAARFNRVNRNRIVIADPAVGQVEIVGLFRANDPEHFAKAAAAVAGADVEVKGGQIVIKSKQKTLEK